MNSIVAVSNWSLVFAFVLVMVAMAISAKEKLGLTRISCGV